MFDCFPRLDPKDGRAIGAVYRDVNEVRFQIFGGGVGLVEGGP